MRIGIFDLEMSNLNADFGILLCGVVKEYQGKSVILRLDDMPGYKKDMGSDRLLAIALREAIQPFDIIVTYNGRRFDVPYLNSRLAKYEEPPLERQKHIDLLYTVRYGLKLHSASLNSVQQFFELPTAKTQMEAARWIRALTGSKTDFDYIVDHCVKDVKLLEEVFNRVKHLVRNIHV